ncbi:MAG TPA: class I SAM-dependent methyltransferase [Polyangiaceae bacterium]
MTTTELAKEDLGLGTAYERVAIYRLFDRWAQGLKIDTAAEGPLDGMAGIPGLHLLGFARRGVRVRVFLPEDEALARVRRIYQRHHAEKNLTTGRLAEDAIPSGPVDVLVSYNALPLVPDWKGYLERLLRADARWFFVVVSNPVSYGTYLRRVQRVLRGEKVVELFDHEAAARTAIEPQIERVGRILSHDYLDCPWWPDFLLPAKKNLAGDTLAKLKKLTGRGNGSNGSHGGGEAPRRFVFGEDKYPFFEGEEGYDDLRRSMRIHPVFDAAPEPVARFFGHLHGYLVEKK